MRAFARIDSLTIMGMHPQNDSYPFCSVNCTNFSFDYNNFFDHDTQHLVIQTLEVLDHTQYPHTLDPSRAYSRDDHIESSKVLTRKSSLTSKNQNMLDMSILLFHFPMERTCPKARGEDHKHHDKFLKMELRCLKLHYVQEYVYRLYEYLYYQVLAALSDSNPYQEGRKQADLQFRELITLARKTAAPIGTESAPLEFEQLDPLTLHPLWTILNGHLFSELQQSPLCTGMDIKIDHPLLVLKDRFYKDKGEI